MNDEYQTPIRSELTNREELIKRVSEMSDKYLDLVWYARSPHKSVIRDVYNKNSDDIIESALNAQARIEEKYPDDIDTFNESPDFKHGFNSGMLAALRYVLTANEIQYYDDQEEPGEVFPVGGIEQAEEEFPWLDS